MKFILPIFIGLMCSMTCCTSNSENNSANNDNPLLNVADDAHNFCFSEDTALSSCDPHAFWLMNRMMQMVQHVKTAEDNWNWALAMDESINEYNKRLGRKIGSRKAATLAIEELIYIYTGGNQPEINTASYVESILAIYRATYNYQNIIDGYYAQDNEPLKKLYQREYAAWFDLNKALNGIMCYYTYALVHYTSLSMDINDTFASWSTARAKELEIEEDLLGWSSEPYQTDAKTISAEEFDTLINFFLEQTLVPIEPESGDENDPSLSKMVSLYRTALTQWRAVREEIAQTIKEENAPSYREITKQIHTRFYNDLKALSEALY